MNNRYWGYRIATSNINFFRDELVNHGRLRQGWGYDESQNLKNFKASEDSGARRNFSIFNNVKKGDILLVPRLPNWSSVAIVKATDNFKEGYRFGIPNEQGDFGHIFPAKFIKSFSRDNMHVDSAIRSSLRNPARFWNMDYLAESIDKLIKCEENLGADSLSDRVDSFVGTIFEDSEIKHKIYEKFNEKFEATEWEHVFVEGLKCLFPYYNIERTGGKGEEKHGTDIKITIPGLLSERPYVIALQIKDYEGKVETDPLSQLSKAENWWSDENTILIDKILVVTKADKSDNEQLLKIAKGKNITVLMGNDVKELLYRISLIKASLNFTEQ